jgi:hypothetical protein
VHALNYVPLVPRGVPRIWQKPTFLWISRRKSGGRASSTHMMCFSPSSELYTFLRASRPTHNFEMNIKTGIASHQTQCEYARRHPSRNVIPRQSMAGLRKKARKRTPFQDVSLVWKVHFKNCSAAALLDGVIVLCAFSFFISFLCNKAAWELLWRIFSCAPALFVSGKLIFLTAEGDNSASRVN